MTAARFDPFVLLAMLPPGSLVAMQRYVSGFDGWGGWGAAPLLLLPVFLSIPITLAAIIRWRTARSRGEAGHGSLLPAFLASIPLLWFGWRLIVTS